MIGSFKGFHIKRSRLIVCFKFGKFCFKFGKFCFYVLLDLVAAQ